MVAFHLMRLNGKAWDRLRCLLLRTEKANCKSRKRKRAGSHDIDGQVGNPVHCRISKGLECSDCWRFNSNHLLSILRRKAKSAEWTKTVIKSGFWCTSLLRRDETALRGDQRMLTTIPLAELWNDYGTLTNERVTNLHQYSL